MLRNIDVNTLVKKIGTINIIDIRSVEKYNTSHIETSKNIPISFLISNPNKYLNKDEEYYLYCQYGKTSIKATLALSRLGYKIINIIGGYEAWLLK